MYVKLKTNIHLTNNFAHGTLIIVQKTVLKIVENYSSLNEDFFSPQSLSEKKSTNWLNTLILVISILTF